MRIIISVLLMILSSSAQAQTCESIFVFSGTDLDDLSPCNVVSGDVQIAGTVDLSFLDDIDTIIGKLVIVGFEGPSIRIENFDFIGEISVSYTHLTLPTIYSV